MKKEIITDNGVFSYEEVELFLGRKILDPDICKKNLFERIGKKDAAGMQTKH